MPLNESATIYVRQLYGIYAAMVGRSKKAVLKIAVLKLPVAFDACGNVQWASSIVHPFSGTRVSTRYKGYSHWGDAEVL